MKTHLLTTSIFILLCLTGCDNNASTEETNTEIGINFYDPNKPKPLVWDGTHEGRVEWMMDHGVDPCEEFPEEKSCNWRIINAHD